MEELAPYMRGWRSYFGLLRNARSADWLNPLGPVVTAGGHLAAVENPAPSPGGSVGTGGTFAAGHQYGWKRARPLVPREGQGSACRAF
jgi:hypothetical protein